MESAFFDLRQALKISRLDNSRLSQILVQKNKNKNKNKYKNIFDITRKPGLKINKPRMIKILQSDMGNFGYFNIAYNRRYEQMTFA
jgi:hypothetical protein